MSQLRKRLDALEGRRPFLKLGEMLDDLAGYPAPIGKRVDPTIVAALAALPSK